MTHAEIGFVGVGKMGGRMARRLIDAGYHATIYDPAPSAMEPLVKIGATEADSPAAVGSAADIVLASLPTPAVVQAAALGPSGVVESRRAKVLVDTSTTGATVAKQVAQALAARGITAVDAPVSGGIQGAEKGTLALMVSGPESTLARVKPVLEILGKIFLVGTEAGQGQMMKLLNNLVSATAMAITSEAMAMGVKAGLDPALMVDVFNAGTARNSVTQDKIKQYVISRKFNYGFGIGLMNKDIRLCIGEADALGVPLVVGSAVRQLLAIATATEGADADLTTIARTVEKWAGVKIGEQQA